MIENIPLCTLKIWTLANQLRPLKIHPPITKINFLWHFKIKSISEFKSKIILPKEQLGIATDKWASLIGA